MNQFLEKEPIFSCLYPKISNKNLYSFSIVIVKLLRRLFPSSCPPSVAPTRMVQFPGVYLMTALIVAREPAAQKALKEFSLSIHERPGLFSSITVCPYGSHRHFNLGLLLFVCSFQDRGGLMTATYRTLLTWLSHSEQVVHQGQSKRDSCHDVHTNH